MREMIVWYEWPATQPLINQCFPLHYYCPVLIEVSVCDEFEENLSAILWFAATIYETAGCSCSVQVDGDCTSVDIIP